MYLEYYGLSEPPFDITPNPRFSFFSAKHREAFNHLLYGIRERKGFVQLTGEVGCGKTTLCRSLLSQLGKAYETALILNPVLNADLLMKAIAMDSRVMRRSSSSIFRMARTSAPMKNASGTRGSNIKNRSGSGRVAPTKYCTASSVIRPASAQRKRGRLKRGRQDTTADISDGNVMHTLHFDKLHLQCGSIRFR